MSNQLRNGLTVFMLVLLAVSAFAAGYLTRELTGVRSDAYAQQDMSLFWEAWGHIQNSFIGEIPADTAVTYGAIRGSLSALNDPYTVFIEPAIRSTTQNAAMRPAQPGEFTQSTLPRMLIALERQLNSR